MSDREDRVEGGCRLWLVVTAQLIWFVLALIAPAILVDRLLGGGRLQNAADGVILLATALAAVVPFLAVAWLARGRPGWQKAGAVATSLSIAGGYVALDAAIDLLVPQSGVLISPSRRWAGAGLRVLILTPYAVLATWLTPLLTGIAGPATCSKEGIAQFHWRLLSLAFLCGALVTMPWPVTGALGDSLTSAALCADVLARVVLQTFVFWGLVFQLLNRSFVRTKRAASLAVLIYGLSALGGFLPEADWEAFPMALFLLPLGILLAELRVRAREAIPLIPVAFCYVIAPVLFVDPRDAVASGIPELQHLASYLVSGFVVCALGAMLWLGRRASDSRDRHRERRSTGWRGVSLAAIAAWGLWMGVYFGAGEPGFFNHGFLIVLQEQADLEPAYKISNRRERIEYVYTTLVETADATQSSLRAELDELGVGYRPYYIVNMIRVDGHRWLMGRFRGRPEVAGVILNPNVREYPRRIPFPYEAAGGDAAQMPAGLSAIRASTAWAQGVTGAGIVVGGQDTGYDWDHPALKARYRGWDGEKVSHDYNWHDAWDDTRVPFDDGSHGTHTMGTVVGDDGAGNRVGVAPGAQWIGCRNMRRDFGNPGSYAECMEFLLAPYPFGGSALRDGDVGRTPDIINNSWGCPPMEGCFPDTLKPAVEALRAAGVMMVVSAGNDGPACGTAGTPPANYDAALSVGATTAAGDVLSFSSRGPVDGLTKPDIVAPGQRVYSSVPGGGYAYASGTSMAGPHVAGTVALMWSADTALVGDISGTERALCRTAAPRGVNQSCTSAPPRDSPLALALSHVPCACGGVRGVPNNVFGCGIVDAGAAVESILEP